MAQWKQEGMWPVLLQLPGSLLPSLIAKPALGRARVSLSERPLSTQAPLRSPNYSPVLLNLVIKACPYS